MFRIDNLSAAVNLKVPAPAGSPGYFSNGNPATGEVATVVDADWMNTVQEELAFVIETSGLVLDKDDRTQLYRAISRLTRRRLTAPTMFWVDSDGGDNNNEGTQASPWADPTFAYNFIRDRIDLNGYTATIKLVDGEYGGILAQFPANGPHVVIQGNPIDPAKVVIFNPAGPAVLVDSGAFVFLDSVTLRAAGAPVPYHIAGYGLAAIDASAQFNNLICDTCDQAHLYAAVGAVLGPVGAGVPYTIAGSAKMHAYSANGSILSGGGAQVIISGVPTFSQAFAVSERAATLDYTGAIFTGGAHGKKFDASVGGIIVTGTNGDVNFFPGDVAGTFTQGGIYW